MAVRASGDILIEASPEAVLDALADIESVPSWSSVHKRARVVDRYPDGRPHHVEVVVKVLGLVDHELLEYHWGSDWVVWDVERTVLQHDQHVEYTVRPEAGCARVRFDITLEPSAPLPDVLIKRAKKTVLDSATSGLRSFVLARLNAQTDKRAGKDE
jgi:hypothetical protein